MEVIRLCEVTPEKALALKEEGCYLKIYSAGEEEFLYIIHPPKAARREA